MKRFHARIKAFATVCRHSVGRNTPELWQRATHGQFRLYAPDDRRWCRWLDQAQPSARQPVPQGDVAFRQRNRSARLANSQPVRKWDDGRSRNGSCPPERVVAVDIRGIGEVSGRGRLVDRRGGWASALPRPIDPQTGATACRRRQSVALTGETRDDLIRSPANASGGRLGRAIAPQRPRCPKARGR